MPGVFYLDTSGLNFLADHVKDFEMLASAKKHLGFDLYLSPIGLWEILLNTKDDRRDYIIYWAQFNCSKSLLKSPTEIIIQYIKQGCPLKDRKVFFKDPYTKLELGVTWQNIHKKIDRTIPVDIEGLKERSYPIRQLSKKLKSIICEMCDEDYSNYEIDPFHLAMKKALENIGKSSPLSKEREKELKISLIFLFFIVCTGFELQNNVVREYWDDIKIEDPFERFDYLIENHPTLLIRGPIVEMSKTAKIQMSMENSKSRGLLHDCFHSVYCYYSSNFITGDAHFKSLRDNIKHPVFSRIIMTEEIKKIWNKTMEKLIG